MVMAAVARRDVRHQQRLPRDGCCPPAALAEWPCSRGGAVSANKLEEEHSD